MTDNAVPELKWRYLRKGNLATFDGRYTITDATIWEHSRVVQERVEARYGDTSLGFFATGRDAIVACNNHNEGQQQ